jgi:hypothetical protein
MKKILLCAAFIAVSFTSIAQVGIGTTTPDDSAVLDISSTSKGLLIPRMTTAQLELIQVPIAEGLMVYVMGDVGAGVAGSFMYYDGNNWKQLFRADLTIPEIISAGQGKDDLYENSGEQQVVYTILVNNAITGEITYFLEGMGDTSTALLRLGDINKNEVILIADPDYEEQEIYNFEVRAVSAAGKSSEWKEVSFSILPINEPASFSSDPSFTALENQTSIGRVTAIDPDAGATLRYSISETDKLLISDSGVITFKDAPDFENVPAINSYTATVTVTDGHVPNDKTQEITVNVENVNEPPTITSDDIFEPRYYPFENSYEIITEDVDANDNVTLTILNLPNWLTLNGNILSGNPENYTKDMVINIEACDNSEECSYFNLKVQVQHNTFLSTKTQKIWMDRNLGATKVGVSSTDSDSFGFLYQWGRDSDGHQIRQSIASDDGLLVNSDYAGDRFILGQWVDVVVNRFDWLKEPDVNRWNDDGVNKGIHDPCPTGFRVPTGPEFVAEFKYITHAELWENLKLPYAGYRHGGIDQIWIGPDTNTEARYWSSTTGNGFSVSINWSEQILTDTPGFPVSRSWGHSVRCIKVDQEN